MNHLKNKVDSLNPSKQAHDNDIHIRVCIFGVELGMTSSHIRCSPYVQ